MQICNFLPSLCISDAPKRDKETDPDFLVNKRWIVPNVILVSQRESGETRRGHTRQKASAAFNQKQTEGRKSAFLPEKKKASAGLTLFSLCALFRFRGFTEADRLSRRRM
jgi:hypothetical protein